MKHFNLAAIATAALFLAGALPAASAAPRANLSLTAGSDVVFVHGRRRHHHSYYGGTVVRAPFAYVDTRGRQTWVDAPFTAVRVHRRGVWVRAPYVDLYVPR